MGLRLSTYYRKRSPTDAGHQKLIKGRPLLFAARTSPRMFPELLGSSSIPAIDMDVHGSLFVTVHETAAVASSRYRARAALSQ